MRFTNKDFQDMIQIVSIFTATNTTERILTQINLQLVDGDLFIRATDNKLGCESVLRTAGSESDFNVTVDGSELKKLAKKLKKFTDVNFEVINDKVKISSGKFSQSITCGDGRNYPIKEFNEIYQEEDLQMCFALIYEDINRLEDISKKNYR